MFKLLYLLRVSWSRLSAEARAVDLGVHRKWRTVLLMLSCCFLGFGLSACGDRFADAQKNAEKESAAILPIDNDQGQGEAPDAIIAGLWRIDPDAPSVQTFLDDSNLVDMRFLVAERTDQSEADLLFCDETSTTLNVMTLSAIEGQPGMYELPVAVPGLDEAIRFENRNGLPYIVVPSVVGDIDAPLVAAEAEDTFTVSLTTGSSRKRVLLRNSHALCGALTQANAAPGTDVVGRFAFAAGGHIATLIARMAGGLQEQIPDASVSTLLKSGWFEDLGESAQQALLNDSVRVNACSTTSVSLVLTGDTRVGDASFSLTHELTEPVTCPSDNVPVVAPDPATPPPPPSNMPPTSPPPATTPPQADLYAATCGSLERPGGLTGRWGLNPATQGLIEVAVGDFPEFTQLIRSSFFFVDRQTDVSATICEDPRVRLLLTRNGDKLESKDLGLLLGGGNAEGVIQDIAIKNDAEITLNLVDPPLPVPLNKRVVVDQTVCWDETGLDPIRAVNQICAASLPTALRLTFPLQGELMEVIFNLPNVPKVGEYVLDSTYTAILISNRFTAMGMDKTQLIKEGRLEIQSIGEDTITGRFRLAMPGGEVATGNFSSFLSRLAETLPSAQ